MVVPLTHPVIGLSSDFHISKVANWAPTHLRAKKSFFSDLGERPLEGSLMVWVDPKWPKLSGFYVVTTLETILG